MYKKISIIGTILLAAAILTISILGNQNNIHNAYAAPQSEDIRHVTTNSNTNSASNSVTTTGFNFKVIQSITRVNACSDQGSCNNSGSNSITVNGHTSESSGNSGGSESGAGGGGTHGGGGGTHGGGGGTHGGGGGTH